jgi:hypothetical protein
MPLKPKLPMGAEIVLVMKRYPECQSIHDPLRSLSSPRAIVG